MRKQVVFSYVAALALVFGGCSKDAADDFCGVKSSTVECFECLTITKSDFDNAGTEYNGSAKVTIHEGITLEKVKSNDHELVFASNVASGTITLSVKNGNAFAAYTFNTECAKGTKHVFSGKQVSGIKYGKFVPEGGGDPDPDPDPNYVGAKLKSLAYSNPTISTTDGVTFDYTGTAVFTLEFEKNGEISTEELAINDIKAIATAKVGTVVSKVILEEVETLGTPVLATTPTGAELRFNNGKLIIPFTLTNDNVFVTIRKENIPLEFGQGAIVFNSADL
jgi:hypothetical protein